MAAFSRQRSKTLTDGPIEELYFLASSVKTQGQEFIPVHVFPIRYNVKKSADFFINSNIDDCIYWLPTETQIICTKFF